MTTSYINEFGVKTSKKLDKIKDNAWNYIYGGNGYDAKKFMTKKYALLQSQFEKEADLIGTDSNLGDCLA